MSKTSDYLLERLAKITAELVPELAFEAGHTYERALENKLMQEWEKTMVEVERYFGKDF